MVFEQVVYLYSENGKAGFQIWGSSDLLVFPTPSTLPHKIGSVTWACKRKKGRKEREESEIIRGHKLDMNLISTWICDKKKSHQTNILNR